MIKSFKIGKKKNKSINKVEKNNLDSETKAKIYATKKFKKDKRDAKKSLKKQLKTNSVNINLIYDLFCYLPKKTFTEKRAFICLILLFVTRCRISELKNFNKLSITNLIQDGSLILNTKRINISDFEKNILKEYLLLIDEFYKVISEDKHILYSSFGKEIKEKTLYKYLNNVLKKIGDEKGINLLSKSFRIGYISEISKYYNIQIKNLKLIQKD